jgi:hypothetical protein
MTRTRATAGLVALAAAAVVLILGVGIGGGQDGHRHASEPFAWLHPAPPPAGWTAVRIAEAIVAEVAATVFLITFLAWTAPPRAHPVR